MAQLNDSIVSGNLRVTDETLTDTVQATKIKVPTTSGGTAYGVGSNGQVIKSNGTSAYWSDDTNTDVNVTQTADDSSTSNFEVLFSNTADNTTRTETSKKSSKLKFQPSTGNLQATQLNGVTIGSSPKFTDHYAWSDITSKPTTISGYGITDAKIASGVITLGSNTITPLTSSSTLEEERLKWGGPSKTGAVSPVGMSLSEEHSANRLAFINGNALTFEYSSDAGSTWTTYTEAMGYNAKYKSQFCTQNIDLPVGRPDSSTEITLNGRSRVTFTCQDGTHTWVYTNPKKMLVRVSTASPIMMLVETRTGTNYQNDGAWTAFNNGTEYELQGWSGWNDIPLILDTLGGGTTQYGNKWQLRLTFRPKSVSASSPKACSVTSVRIYGDNAWTINNNLARIGHLYSYDMEQNATFPANLKMNGNKQVGYLTATPTSGQVVVTDGTSGGMTTTGYTIAKSVPSDAVFTDHTYSGTGLISVNGSGVISTSAEVNQNAFSKVKVGSTTVEADTKTDTLELVGSNVTLTPDATNDKVTIGITSSDVTTALGYTPYSSANPSGYQANVIETVKVNGTALTPSSKAVDISVPTITDTYSSTSTNGMSGKAVASALGTLDVTGASSISASKTISAWSETDGKVSITTQDISITKSQVSDFPTLGTASAKDVPSSGNASSTQVVMGNDTRLTNSRTPTSHTHGNIQNNGTLQTTDITIANGDKLIVTDASSSTANQVARTSVTFDGSTTTQCLTKKGTWANFTNNAGTITGITMNGSSKGTSGVVDLGTVITDKSDKMDKQNPTGSGRFLMNDPTVTGDCYGSNALGGSSGRNTLYYTNYSTIVCGMDNQIGNTSSDVSNNCLMAGSNNTIYNGADNGTVLGNANRIDNASNSFVTGLGNTNIWNNCSVSGRYNNTTAFPISTISNDLSTYSVLECIGNGSGTTTDQPQYWNARVLLGNGNEYVAGDIRSGGNISADNGRVLAGLDVNATTDVTAGKNMKANGRYITPYSTTATTNCINPTQSGGSAAATIGNLQFSVVGNLAILNCTIAWNESIHSSAITLGQLYTAFKPIAQVGCIALTDNGNGGSFGYGRLIIDTNGYIKIYPVTNSAYSSCHRVYVNVNYVLSTAYTVS